MTFLFACVVIFIAAIIQKITGMGFALVATPVLVLLYGPTQGVLIIITLGLLLSLLMVINGIKLITWKPTLTLIAAGLTITPPAAYLTTKTHPGWLLIIVGTAAALALSAPHIAATIKTKPNKTKWLPNALTFGAIAGFLHVTSGLSGPPLVAYGTKTKWNHLNFVASIQIIFITFSTATLTFRGITQIPAKETIILAATAVTGLATASLLLKKIPPKIVRITMFTIAWLGAALVLIRGIATILTQ